MEAKDFIFEEAELPEKKLSKAVVISTEGIFEKEMNKDGVDLIILDADVTCFRITGSGGQIAPSDVIVYYFSGKNAADLKTRISSYTENLGGHVATVYLSEHVECVFDYESEVAAAEKKFHELVGDDVEFLEPAPEPEDIVHESAE